MGGIRGIRLRIIQHCVQRGGQRRESGETGKNCAIADFAIEHKGGSLRHLQCVELGRVGADALLDRRRLGAFA